jgi:hypothetical protein
MRACGGNAIPNKKAHSPWIETCITPPTLLPLIFLYTSFVKKLSGAMAPSLWTRPHSTQLTLLCITCEEESHLHLIRSEEGPACSQCKPPCLHQILTTYISGRILLYPHPISVNPENLNSIDLLLTIKFNIWVTFPFIR